MPTKYIDIKTPTLSTKNCKNREILIYSLN
jgi:hypothetical protein